MGRSARSMIRPVLARRDCAPCGASCLGRFCGNVGRICGTSGYLRALKACPERSEGRRLGEDASPEGLRCPQLITQDPLWEAKAARTFDKRAAML